MRIKTLHNHLIVNLLIIPIVFLLIAAAVIQFNVRSLTDGLITQKTENTLDVLEQKVHHYLEHPINELGIMEELIPEETFLAKERDIYIDHFIYIERFDLINDQGIVIETYPEIDYRKGFDLSESEIYIESVYANNPITYGKVIHDPVIDATTYWITKKINDNYLVAYVDLSLFEALLSELSIEDGQVGIIDEKGVYVSHTNPLNVEQRVVDSFSSEIRKGTLASGASIKYKNEDYKLLYRDISDYDWYIVYYQDTSMVDQPVQRLLISVALVFSILVGLILFYITRTLSVIDASVSGMMALSANIADGNYSVGPQSFKYREFETLFKSLRVMSNEVESREEEISSLNNELDDNYYTLVVLLAKAIEAKDNYTGGHCERVRDLAMHLSKGLNLSEENNRQLKFGSTLHDIGKLGIPESILNKSGSFTDEEYDFVKKHCSLGYEIMAELPSMHLAKEIILHHHEHIDGKGYPYGLKGDEIPLLARIVSIADAFDAMTSERPYKKRYMSQSEAFKELERCSGTQFDGELVQVFISQMKKNSVAINDIE